MGFSLVTERISLSCKIDFKKVNIINTERVCIQHIPMMSRINPFVSFISVQLTVIKCFYSLVNKINELLRFVIVVFPKKGFGFLTRSKGNHYSPRR